MGAAFLSIVLVGCGAPVDTPAPEVDSPTPTLAPPTATRVPPTSTETPDPSTATPTKIPRVGTDITIELPEGDPARGQALAKNEIKDLLGLDLACSSCHEVTAIVAPDFVASGEWPAVGERGAIRIAEADYTGAATTPEQYLFESIVLPEAYYIEAPEPGDWFQQMPDYSQRLSRQDVADLIAYMLSFVETD